MLVGGGLGMSIVSKCRIRYVSPVFYFQAKFLNESDHVRMLSPLESKASWSSGCTEEKQGK